MRKKGPQKNFACAEQLKNFFKFFQEKSSTLVVKRYKIGVSINRGCFPPQIYIEDLVSPLNAQEAEYVVTEDWRTE
jgi:hypothetical protein